MGRKRKERTPEEEQEYQQAKKIKRNEYMRNYRIQKKYQNKENNSRVNNIVQNQPFERNVHFSVTNSNNSINDIVPDPSIRNIFNSDLLIPTNSSHETLNALPRQGDNLYFDFTEQNQNNNFDNSTIFIQNNSSLHLPVIEGNEFDTSIPTETNNLLLNLDTIEPHQVIFGNDDVFVVPNSFLQISPTRRIENENPTQDNLYGNSIPGEMSHTINNFNDIQLNQISSSNNNEFYSINNSSLQCLIGCVNEGENEIIRNQSVIEIPNFNSDMNTERSDHINVLNDEILCSQIPLFRGTINRSMEQELEFNRRRRERQNYTIRANRQTRRQSSSTYRNLSTVEHYLGKMDIRCIHRQAYHFKNEKVANKGLSFNDCCSHGEALTVPKFPEVPEELKSLYLLEHQKSDNFYENIRSYNSSLAFASFNANLCNFPSNRPGPYCFKIQGQIYCQVNTSLYAETNQAPCYGQLFFTDAEEALEARLNRNVHLDSDLLHTLDDFMRTHNIFAQSYMMMKDEVSRQENLNNDPSELQLSFTLKPGSDRRRYNIQNCNQVAAIFNTSADGEIPESYVTIRVKNTRELKILSSMDPNVEPWIYPLFYPYGNRGWRSDINRKSSSKRVSRSAYVKFHIAIRDEFNAILYGRKLFQQWLVDFYVKVEKDRLQFFRDNQQTIRADSYQGLQDYLQNVSNQTGQCVRKIVILPSTFIGSPRNMMQNYQDAMAIVRKFGIPNLFITMTCNPNWKDIKENLFNGQQPSDRPDICVRVFYLKVKHLIHLLTKENIYGKVQAYVYVIEFQKRGLPHCHLVVNLDENSKIETPEQIDEMISAEIPDKDENPILYNIVMTNMIHGPCGAWCQVDGKCSKHFPKEFAEETSVTENGKTIYRRRNDGRLHERHRNFLVNNQWVVPYSPKLSQIFNCHINVEIVNHIEAVKYLYKYIYKGHDAANVIIENSIEHDEIKNFLDVRYVGPCEAVWRLLGKGLQAKSHSVVKLPVHLPDQHQIRLPEIPDQNHLEIALRQTTMLLDYFALNARDESARQYTYVDIPNHYIFKKVTVNNQQIHRWEPRQRYENVIGPMYSVNPSNIELYHLRLLLHSSKGATSFENLRTVREGEEPLGSYVETCVALGLVESEDEWQHCLEEAVQFMMPIALRSLFVRILIHYQPHEPHLLWNEFKNSLSEDFLRKFDSNVAHSKAFQSICNGLEKEGYHISQFPTMNQITLDLRQDDDLNENEIHSNERNTESTESETDYETIGNNMYAQLNIEQKKFVDSVMNSIENNDLPSKCYYLDGPGGSGKTFVYKTIYNLLRSKNMNVSSMAFTGIAAILLPNGRTVHKILGLPVPLYSDSSSQYTIESKEGQNLKNTDVFLWDEAPMAPRYALEILDRTLRDFTKCDKPFGGKIIVLGGDFRQLLPVKINGSRHETVNLSIKFSYLWREFKTFKLIRNMRALPEKVEFSEFLLSLGNGELNDQDDLIKLPDQCVSEPDSDIVKNVFENVIKQKDYKLMSKYAILSARNKDVNDINEKVVDLLDKNTERIYYSLNSVEKNNDAINDSLQPEHLSTLNPSSLPPHELRLRKYSTVMLIRNISAHEGLCNGTRVLVLNMTDHLIQCQILTGDKAGDIVFINRITLISENDYPFAFRRRQFPIKLAFAMTINKSQGQTLEKVAIDLRLDVFSHGQLYVALSRVRSWSSVKIFLQPNNLDHVVKNLVYPEILR